LEVVLGEDTGELGTTGCSDEGTTDVVVLGSLIRQDLKVSFLPFTLCESTVSRKAGSRHFSQILKKNK